MTTKQDIAVLGICGGIAAYKAVTVASKLRQTGLDVHVLMTEAATKFVTPLTFEAVSRNKVVVSTFPDADAESGEDFFPHLYPSTRADVFCVLPATADMIGKMAHGYADDIVCTAALPIPKGCLRYVCPSMNADMWENATVRANMATLSSAGWVQLGPETGVLACGVEGFGRMTEPEAIVERIVTDLANRQRLTGRKILVLSGPTVEAIDPVRFISNHSSGKMGKAIAEEASKNGAQVEFVTGPVPEANLPSGPNITHTHVMSADDMLKAGQNTFPSADAAVFVAAVADYRPASAADKKMPKQDALTLDLVRNPDIAATLAGDKNAGQICVGFALETHDGVAHAEEKLAKKNLDAIILNGPDTLGAGSGSFTLIKSGATEDWGSLTKPECARRLIDSLCNLLPNADSK